MWPKHPCFGRNNIPKLEASATFIRKQIFQNTMTKLHFFDPAYDLEIYHGDLPHWRQEGAIYFVTFRLADSLPQAKIQQLKDDRAAWIKMYKHKSGYNFTKEDWTTYKYLFHDRIKKWLDAQDGSCILKRQDIIEVFVNSLRFFEGQKYDLDSFVIMPNHVHVIVAPLNGFNLSEITHSWKSYSANKINKILGLTGQLWQHESYDHIIRNEESLIQIRKYIENNPIKAGIVIPDIAIRVQKTI